MKLPAVEVVRDLVRFAHPSASSLPSSLQAANPMRVAHAVRGMAPSLSTRELELLIRGLVRFSREVGSIGASTSPVIDLFRDYHAREDQDPEFADWVLANRNNIYEPFGSSVSLSVRNRREMEEERARSAKASAAKAAEEQRRMDAARERRAAEATERLPNAVRRGDVAAVTALLQKGADWRSSVLQHGSLRQLANAAGRQRMVEHLTSLGIT